MVVSRFRDGIPGSERDGPGLARAAAPLTGTGLARLGGVIRDFKLALRQLARAPGFTAIAVLTLAVALGVNSAVFALVNAVGLRKVVGDRPEEVVNVFSARQRSPGDYRRFSHAEYQLVRDSRETFAEVAPGQYALAAVGRDEEMRRSLAYFTSDVFFSVTRAAPALGRFFTAAESRPGADVPVVVISHELWRRLGGRADILGSRLPVNGQSFTVIGVTRRGYSGLHAMLGPEVWLPLGVYDRFSAAFRDIGGRPSLADPQNYTLNLVARLRPGVTAEAARVQLPVLARRLDDIQPADSAGPRALQIHPPARFNISSTPVDERPVGVLSGLLVAMAAVVLLIASLNLANMLLARGSSRSREMAVRLALGAARWRIVRQLLCEGLLLAVAGGALGLLVSVWSNDLLLHSLGAAFDTMRFSLVLDLRPDARVVAATFVVCLAATMLFGLGPALRASRADLVGDLGSGECDRAVSGRGAGYPPG